MDGSIDPYQNTTEGADIFFGCNPGFVPAGRMTAVCEADGRWNPDPADHRCTCKYPSKTCSCHHHTKIVVYISCINRKFKGFCNHAPIFFMWNWMIHMYLIVLPKVQ